MAAPAAQAMNDEPEGPLQNKIEANLCCPGPWQALCSVLFPCSWFSACTVISVKQEAVLLSMGKYVATLREPGCYCVNSCCLTTQRISTATVGAPLQNVKVADAKGNPLLLSGVVTYRVIDSKKAALDVLNYSAFVTTQGTTVMKKVASKYPYEARGNEPSLKSEADHLRNDLIRLLQERVEEAGIKVLNFELNDLAYSPEIAQQMLVRQQAEAVVDARKLIAEGATEIASETLHRLEEKGIIMDDHDKARMASNLVVIICGESGVQPTLSMT